MSKDDLFRNTLATNGLARGYAPRPHKRKRKGLRFAVVVLLLALACVVYFSSASANDDNALDPTLFEVMDEVERQRADYEAKKSEICRKLDRKIADKLIRKIDRPNFSPLESDLNLIEAWEGYCKGRVFDQGLIIKSLQYEIDGKKND